MNKLLKYLNENNINIENIKYLETEYNECGGYISFFDENKNELSNRCFFNKDSDYILKVASDFSKKYNILFL